MITRHMATACPACKKTLNASGSFDDATATPREGDITLCVDCGTALIYSDSLSLRLATDSDLQTLNEEEAQKVRHYCEWIHELNKTRPV